MRSPLRYALGWLAVASFVSPNGSFGDGLLGTASAGPRPSAGWGAANPGPGPIGAQQGGLLDELENLEGQADELLRLERAEAALNLRRGQWRRARKALRQHLRDDPRDGESRALMSFGLLGQQDLDGAIGEARNALGDLPPGAEGAALAGRVWLRALEELGRTEEALGLVAEGQPLAEVIQPEERIQDNWALVRLKIAQGQHGVAREWAARSLGIESDDWRELWARSLCERALGDLVQSSRTLILAFEAAEAADGPEPDLMVALGEVYFESEQEVQARQMLSAGSLFNKAIGLHPGHPDALLGLHALHRLNRLRQSRSPESILAELFEAHPDCLRAVIRGAGDDLSDGHLPRVRRALAMLEEKAPERRDVRILRAALTYVERDRAGSDAILDRLIDAAPDDATPEREVGRFLVELYRFSEALPFLEAAVKRNPKDHLAWTRYAHALANVGNEDAAREAFAKAIEHAQGRQDAWRDNMNNVLQRMARDHVTERFGPLMFSWQPDAAEVYRTYWVPFYESAREELAARYGFTPEHTTIEVFREHGDFSVRSVGFEGFPALGVCFGPVVTALSPLSGMRGRFSWARTGFHEFSHVVHLGLSHNRCPRWITEGLATWEEVNRNPAWTRNMRLDLLNARANNQLIPVRELNRAFRGPRILFGYYQGGLLCEMLIEQHGFSPMVRLLEAFDRGADLDEAIESVFQTTPEAIDRDFERYVDGRLEGLDCEPAHDASLAKRLSLGLSEAPPEDPDARLAWVHDWLTVGHMHYQYDRIVDAAEALRRASSAGVATYREAFLRAALALERGDLDEAVERWKEGFALGGREFRSLMAMGMYQEGQGKLEDALEWFRKAESSFPGYPETDLSAELMQASVLAKLDRKDDAMRATERWLAYNPGQYDAHVQVADWHKESGRYEVASKWYERANEVDPFRRDLHLDWAEALEGWSRLEEAQREYGVALIIPAELDLDHLGPPAREGGAPVGIPLSGQERAEIHYKRAQLAELLQQPDQVNHHLQQALLAKPGHGPTMDWLERIAAEKEASVPE